MEIPVLIQPVPGKGFVATAPAFGWSAEGATADESLANLRAVALNCVAGGFRLRTIDIPATNGPLTCPVANGVNPLSKWAGTMPDDELTAMFRAAVEEYRNEIENDPNR